MLSRLSQPLCIILPVCIVGLFLAFKISNTALLQIVSLFILAFLFSIYLIHTSLRSSTRVVNRKNILLSLAVFLVTLVLILTGGLYSPFLILVHISVIAIGLFFTFPLAMLFLICISLAFIYQFTQDSFILSTASSDPVTVVLYVLSFVTIIPIVEILSSHYHKKDQLSKILSSQVIVEESILEGISEIVFVVDSKAEVFSVNDAAVEALHRTDSQMIHTNIFQFLYLKDKKGHLVAYDDIPFDVIFEKRIDFELRDLRLITTAATSRTVDLKVKPVLDVGEEMKQFCMIIRDTGSSRSHGLFHKSLEAQLKYNAILEDLGGKLRKKGVLELLSHVFLIRKIGADVFLVKTLDEAIVGDRRIRIDLASLVKDAVGVEQEFAGSLHVPLSFSILDFGPRDVAPLLHNIISISPDKLTGPFFTVACDVQYTNSFIQKTIELALLLASSEQSPKVSLSIERSAIDGLVIKIIGNTPYLSEEEKNQLFVPYYNSLSLRTNLDKGSGLEGYIVKTIADSIQIPFETSLEVKNGVQIITFTIVFKKS